MKTTSRVIAAVLILLLADAAHAAAITNGSFETGDFTGWTTSDLADPYSALAVQATGYATDGSYAATHGFDGGGPGTISFLQDIGILDASSARLTFDYYAEWNNGGTQDRVFSVVLLPSGGGTVLATYEVLRAGAGTDSMGGSLVGDIDFSAYIGTNARIAFEAYIPENYTGPAFMAIDKIALSSVPEPSTLVLVGGGLLLAMVRRPRRDA